MDKDEHNCLGRPLPRSAVAAGVAAIVEADALHAMLKVLVHSWFGMGKT